MGLSQSLSSQEQVNPLDLVEDMVEANEWPSDRRNDREISVEVPGQWCGYSLYFAWSEDLRAIHLSCALDMRVPEDKKAQFHELLALSNEHLWLGHFTLWRDEGLPLFRHSMFLRGMEGASEIIEDLVDVAVGECERFYPAFHFVALGDKGAEEAVAAALLEPMGEA